MKSEKKRFDDIEVTSRLLNIIFNMPVEKQLDLLDSLDASEYEGSRRYARTDLKNPWVVLISPEKKKSSDDCLIRNISRCGVFIETSRSSLVGEKITIKFQLPVSQKLFKVVGEIVRSQENGIGVKFKRQLSKVEH